MRIIWYEQVFFLLHRQSCCQVFCSNKLDHFSWTLLFVFCKHVSSRTRGTHPQEKAVQVSHPANRLVQINPQIRRRRHFWPQVILRLLVSTSGPHIYKCSPNHDELNGQFRSKNRRGTHPKKRSKLQKNSAWHSAPRRWPAKQCSCSSDRFSFLLLPSCSNLQIVTPKPQFSQWSSGCRI